MSQETLEWLNQNTLVGFTEKYGHAWHFDGQADNHFPGAVPMERVVQLIDFPVEETPLEIVLPDGTTVLDQSRKVIYRPDAGIVLGVHKPTYRIHRPLDWLVTRVQDILDDGELDVGSAGALRNYAVIWVQLEMPENVVTPEGVEFRPHLLARTSFDGTLASTYGMSVTMAVCDNTLEIAASEHGGRLYRTKHTALSDERPIEDAREALQIVHTMADDFSAEVAALCATTVTDQQWSEFLDTLIPVAEDEGRSRTIAVDKQAVLRQLYTDDARVAPWTGTAFGVLQAVNTATQHEFKGGRGVEEGRNLTKKVYGQFATADQQAMQVLEAVLA